MLRKLLKYDLKWTIKLILVFVFIGTGLAIISRLFELGPDSLFFEIVVGILKGASLSLTITGLANALIRPWVRYGMNMYKDEAYLTNTLPVKRSTHYLSKSLNAFICVLISMLGLVLNVLIMYYSKENLELLKVSLSSFSQTLDMSVFGFVSLFVLVLLVELIFISQCGFFGITYGFSSNQHKIVLTFVFGIILYSISQMVSIVIVFIIALFTDGMYEMVFGMTSAVDLTMLKVLLLVFLLIYTLYTALVYFITNKKLTKGINID